MESVYWRVTQPFTRKLRWRMVAKADSTTLVVRTCVQCAAGTLWKARSSSRSLSRQSARVPVPRIADPAVEDALRGGAGFGHPDFLQRGLNTPDTLTHAVCPTV